MAKKVTDKQRGNSESEKRRLANLKPFRKGQSGNPAGRPKTITLSEALRLELAKANPEGENEETYAEAIASVLVKSAAGGNILAAKEIADRTEGKPKQAIAMDMSVTDWRELARQHGLSETDVISEAKRLITESGLDRGGSTSH
jgi:hypothetical protein